MGFTWDEAVALVDRQRQFDAPLIQHMIAVTTHYNAEVLTPTYDVPGEDIPGRSPNPLLIADAIDKNADRAASVMPSITVPRRNDSDISKRRQRNHTKALQASWHASGMKEMLLGRLYRHLLGYATASMVVEWDPVRKQPIQKLRNPLVTYSEPKDPEDFSEPLWIGYVYGKSTAAILKQYPQLESLITSTITPTREQIWDMLEFMDDDQVMVGLLGPRQPFYYDTRTNPKQDFLTWRYDHRSASQLLSTYPNPAKKVTAFTPRKVTLERVESNVMKLTGLVNEIGRMRTLEKIAAERGVFPDLVAFGDNDVPPTLVNGVWADGRDGEVNLLQGARGFNVVRMDPSVVSRQVADLMENSFIQSAPLDPQLIGESRGAALRTGQALGRMAGFSLDPFIQSVQLIAARTLSVMNESVSRLWRNVGGNQKVWVFSGLAGDSSSVQLNPKTDFVGDENQVYYPVPGADISQIQVALGQAMQTEQMSAATARAANPLVADDLFEGKQISEEKLLRALEQAFVAHATNPQMGGTLVDFAEAVEHFRRTGDLPAAIRRADELARARQANAQPTPEQLVGGLEPTNPGAAASPTPRSLSPIQSTDAGAELRRVMTNINSGFAGRNRIPAPANVAR